MISVVLALLTSASNATAAVLQRRAASQARSSRPLGLSLIGDLIHRRVWLAGIGMVIVAALLQAGALATGPIALVQPIFIVELPLTLLLSSWVWHRRLAPRTWGAVALVTVSLGTGLAAAQPSGGVDHAATGTWILALIATGCFEAVLIVSALRVTRRAPRGPARPRGRVRVRADRGVPEGGRGRARPGPGGLLRDVAAVRDGDRGGRRAVPAAERAAGRYPGRLAADAHGGGRPDQHHLRGHAVRGEHCGSAGS